MYREYTDEALITKLMDDPNSTPIYEELVLRLRPTILGEALMYRKQLPFDTDDYLQEGRIVLWKIATKQNYKKGCFKSYFISAIRFHLRNLYRDYVLKNFIRIGGYEDIRGNTYEILVEAEFAKQYRIKHREECRRSYERKKAREAEERAKLGIPKPEKHRKLTDEELLARRRERSRAYYHAHADEMNQKAKEKQRAKAAARLQPCPV